MTLTVVIYVFPNVEVLDFAGPYEVFTTANRVHGRRHPGEPAPFRIFTVARSDQPVAARAGLRILPDHTLLTCPQPDILVVPGGVVDAEVDDAALVSWIADKSKRATLTASVCTGAFIVAKAGLLTGKSATTHWEDLEDLRKAFPALEVRTNVRWVDEGRVVTSAGIAAGIDMSLHLVSRFGGQALAEATAKQMDVPYRSEAS